MIDKECKFVEGIDRCDRPKCYYNILGMCVRKGSKNYKYVEEWTNFARIKQMNVEEMAEFLDEILKNRCQFCAYNNKHINCNDTACSVGVKEWLTQAKEIEK